MHKELFSMGRIDGEDSLNSQVFPLSRPKDERCNASCISEHSVAIIIVNVSSTYLLPLVGRPLLQI